MEYNYPEKLTEGDFQILLRNVLNNLRKLEQAYSDYQKVSDIHNMLVVRKVIEMHHFTLQNFLKEHTIEGVQ